MADTEETDIEALFTEAADVHGESIEAQERLDDVNEQLLSIVTDLYAQGMIGTTMRHTLVQEIEAGLYAGARRHVQEAMGDASTVEAAGE